MFSTGEQAGFEATIIRPDGSEFNEYDVKHGIDENGAGVTECWLESEDDDVFQIKTERTVNLMRRFETSQWENIGYVDGRMLHGGAWIETEEPNIKESLLAQVPGQDQLRQGLLTFGAPESSSPPELNSQEISSLDEVGIDRSEVLYGLGTIVIRLRPGRWTATSPGPPICTGSSGIMNHLARIIRASNGHDWDPEPEYYDLTAHHPYVWQTFIFKYRHRAALKAMGVIEPPKIPAPPLAVSRKRSRDVSNYREPTFHYREPTFQWSRTSPVQDQGDGSDSDDDDSAWEAAKARRIKKLKAEIYMLEKGSHGKMKAKRDRPIDLCTDSD